MLKTIVTWVKRWVSMNWLSMCLDCAFARPRFFFLRFLFFFFFQASVVDQVFCEQCFRTLFTDPQITFFNNFFIKNRFHNTIYTFKNYFATVFLVSVFSFSKNKLNPNRSLVDKQHRKCQDGWKKRLWLKKIKQLIKNK